MARMFVTAGTLEVASFTICKFISKRKISGLNSQLVRFFDKKLLHS